MVFDNDPLKMAMIMMQAALNILDDLDEREGAVHLQHAIDVVAKAPIGADIKEIDAFLDSPTARALIERFERSDDISTRADHDQGGGSVMPNGGAYRP